MHNNQQAATIIIELEKYIILYNNKYWKQNKT